MYNSKLQTSIKKAMVFLLPLTGIVLIGLLIAVMWWWEIDGRERYFYHEVLVLNEDVKRGAVIEDRMISTIKVEESKKITNAITEKSQLVQMVAKHYIPKHTQLDPQYFDKQERITDGNKLLVKIPNEWIYSVPNTIRKNDTVYFYEVAADVLTQKDKKPQADPTKNGMPGQKKEPETTSTEAPLMLHNSEEEKLLRANLKTSIFKAIVAFVKDGANREVVTLSQVDRIDGSSVVKDIEVIATLEDMKRMEESVRNGHKFVLMYTEGEEPNEIKPGQR